MTEIKSYRARPARRALQYWLQPFALLFFILLLGRLLPVSAVLYESREVQPLPAAQVAYVSIEPDYGMEILRSSMQTWRRSNLGGDGPDGMSMEEVDLADPLSPPLFLEQGALYPGVWTPGVITPLAQSLPALLYATETENRYGNLAAIRQKQTGIHSAVDAPLRTAQFALPPAGLPEMPGAGRCRFYVETLEDGSVAHVLCLNSSVKDVAALERMLYLGRSQGAVQGEIEIWWRSQ